MPGGAVYVGRPTRWGNPYWHMQRFHGLTAALAFYRETAQGAWNPRLLDLYRYSSASDDITYSTHTAWVKRFLDANETPLDAMRYELRGRDLACWCRLDQPCHADILLELANSRE